MSVADEQSRPVLELTNGDEDFTRLVVVAAHPGDDGLAADGPIAGAYAAGVAVYVVLLTAGDCGAPDDPSPSPELTKHRLTQAQEALRRQAPEAPLVFLGAPDRGVSAVESEVTASLVDLIGDGRRTLLVAPGGDCGHPDHRSAGRAAGAAARRTGARFAHTVSGGELVVVDDEAVDDTLDELHRSTPDPWGVDERWYEHRKRQLTLAALPRRRFRRALEVGCSRGALAEDLATRSEEIVAVDQSAMAVHAARKRLADVPGASVAELDVPGQWPVGRFDLVVVSEMGYFLSPTDLDRLIDRIADSLDDDGVVLLCHWRHHVAGWVLDGPDVHERFRASRLPDEAARYEDRDVEIAVLCRQESWPDPDA
jgi:LmbE family N-acetylglucosaminyl deacetylase